MITAPESSPSRITSSPSLSPKTLQSVDVDAGGAATTDIGLDAGQGSGTIHKTPTRIHDAPLSRVNTLGSAEGKEQKKVYSFALTKLILRVIKLEKKVKTNKARRRAKIVISEDEDAEEDGFKRMQRFRRRIKRTKKQLEQERLGHEEAIRLQEQIDEEERQRFTRDAEIAKQLQEAIDIARQEQEKYDLKKALKLQKQLDERKEVVAEADTAHEIDWNDPAMIRFHAHQNRPFFVAEVRKNMCMYLKNQGGYKQSHFKGMCFEEVRLIFEKVWDQNHTFIPKDSEIEKEVTKRPGFDLQQSNLLKDKRLEKFQGQVKINLLKRSIRRRIAENVSYSFSRRDMLKRFDRDDLEKLWDLVKKRFSSTEPTVDKEKVLWVELK
ncbi:hypothetical protein Tco_0908284, partial [Tanacetum coccineum]